LRSQNITGIVTDSIGNPLSDVTILLLSEDSIFSSIAFSDLSGKFAVDKKDTKKGLLVFQHISYITCEQIINDSTSADRGRIVLRENPNMLDLVTVTAERPVLKIDGNVLSYNVDRIIREKAVSNAFDVVKEIPGVTGNHDEVKLIGANSVSVILDGQVSTLSEEQFYNILKSIPATQVKNIEIMYNAPAKYNVRGALINVVTDKSTAEEKKLSGEIRSKFSRSHYSGGGITGNVNYKDKDISLDFMANAAKNKYWSKANVFSKHTINNQTTEIDQNTLDISDMNNLSFRLSGNYSFGNKDKISLSYYFDGDDTGGKNEAKSVYDELVNYELNSANNMDGTTKLNNVHLEYNGHYGLKLGTDYTSYKDGQNNKYIDYQNNAIENDFLNNSQQNIDRWSFFGNYDGGFSDNWTWSIGANGGYNKSKTGVSYLFNHTGMYLEDIDLRLNNNQDEYTGTFYVESENTVNEKLSFGITLQTEYFVSNYNQNGVKTTLWNEWAFFPSATITYSASENSLFQLALSSNKKYPSYWAINPQTTHVNSYMEITGNPLLKPSKKYDGQLIYMLNRKYTLLAFATYRPDYFTQIPYQDDENLKIVYQYYNFDYDLTNGLGCVLPFKTGDFFSTELTLYGIRMQQKLSDFHGRSLKREKYVSAVVLNNSFLLSKSKPDLRLQIDGSYQSDAIQGIYDLGSSYDLLAGLKWTFGKGSLFLSYDNILKRSAPNPTKIAWDNQYNIRNVVGQSVVSILFSWKFSDYKAPQTQNVDQSRFQR
jgi:hypothetical protein